MARGATRCVSSVVMGQRDDHTKDGSARYALLVHMDEDDDENDLISSKHDQNAPLFKNMTGQAWFMRWCKLTRLKLIGSVLILLMVVLFLYTDCWSVWRGWAGSVSGGSPSSSSARGDLHDPEFTYLNPLNHSGSARAPGDFQFDDTRVGEDGEVRRHCEECIRYKHTKRRLPHAIIIGARKAGTRALLNFLNIHPRIQVAKNEVHFFDNDENFGYGFEWYRKKMPYSFPDQITVEKSPAYFVSDVAPSRLYAMNSSIKLLLILRDPVDRAVSDYLQIRENKINRGKSLPAFETLAIDRETGEVDMTYSPIKRSMYWRHMERWLKYFPSKQILVLSGEQLVREPFVIVSQVETFLGIEHRVTKENFYFNESRGFYCFKSDVEERCLVESKGRPHPNINPIVLQKLRSFFRPYNHRLYRLLERDFAWP